MMSRRATVSFDKGLHRALRVKATETERSVSELVNEAVRIATWRQRQRAVRCIQALADGQRPHDCEKLTGQEQYRVRQGPYGVVYAVNDEERTVLVVKVGQRRDVCW